MGSFLLQRIICIIQNFLPEFQKRRIHIASGSGQIHDILLFNLVGQFVRRMTRIYLVCASRCPKGSTRSITLGSLPYALAIPTLWHIPPEN